MSWIQKLYETYNNCQASIGYSEEGVRPLLPICHITAQAHIEIVITKDGKFRRAKIVSEKRDMTTIIPCTESSAGKAGSKPVNHPLCDKLQYVAGDFPQYGGIVTSGFSKDPSEPHRNYLEMLTKWTESEFTHPKAKAILKYVSKETVVQDLIGYKILFVGKDHRFLGKADIDREKNAKDIFSIIESQEDAFIRWVVEDPDVLESKTWKDKTLWESWKNYYLTGKEKEPLCFVSGEDSILTTNYPKYIRREGDGAKLISANDTSGFTYRGRFTTDAQACGVGIEVSQKSHYALSWLISRQGYKKDDLVIVAWATSGVAIPKPMDDPLSMLLGELPTDAPSTASTAQDIAIKLKKKLAGYGKAIGNTTDIVVMGLDSASPGRLSITYYRELTGSDFLQRINDWHNTCSWIHFYGSIDIQDEKTGKPKKKFIPFIGAPAPSDIAEAAYATNRDGKFQMDEKLRKSTIGRILPCIVDGQQIPRDIVESAVRRASNRVALENWQWNKVLTIACALFKKYNRKENYDMTLDPNRKTRDYLYGRLLALAESLEEWALNKAGEDRPTNAARLMQRFSERPYSTWRTIELALAPYKARLGGKSKKRQRLIDEVVAAFNNGDFISDKRLSGEFLLGYHCQREFLRSSRTEDLDDNNEVTETSNTINQ
jgi:CRISPR-associated protein Csd1